MLDEQAANARKRKREEDGETSDLDSVEAEKPIPNSVKKGKQTKKQRREEKGTASHRVERQPVGDSSVDKPESDPEIVRKAKAEKRRQKRESKKTKEEARAAKAKAKKERKIRESALEEDSKDAAAGADASDEDVGPVHGGEIDRIEMDTIVDEPPIEPLSTATPSTGLSPAFDNSENHSGSSSISSFVPPSATGASQSEKPSEQVAQAESKEPKLTPEEIKIRFAARIEAMKRARNADGLNGAPARNRQELMEARRQKEEQRKAHKKELRQKAKEEERQKRDETLARGSPLLSGSPLTPSSPANNFSFSRITFADGQRASAKLNSIIDPKIKLKGPSDPRTALLAAEKKQSRLNGLDESKKADITEKDAWLNARKRAHGERVRDDTSLLKKTLKRKEKQKKKSSKEWSERLEGVKKSQDMKQKKREANLQKRKEDKGKKGGKSGPKKGKGKPKARPGFEGSFRAKAPSGGGAAAAAADGGRRR